MRAAAGLWLAAAVVRVMAQPAVMGTCAGTGWGSELAVVKAGVCARSLVPGGAPFVLLAAGCTNASATVRPCTDALCLSCGAGEAFTPAACRTTGAVAGPGGARIACATNLDAAALANTSAPLPNGVAEVAWYDDAACGVPGDVGAGYVAVRSTLQAGPAAGSTGAWACERLPFSGRASYRVQCSLERPGEGTVQLCEDAACAQCGGTAAIPFTQAAAGATAGACRATPPWLAPQSFLARCPAGVPRALGQAGATPLANHRR